MKKLLFGIDGGGSNTKLLITDYELNSIDNSLGGGSNFLKIGLDEAVSNVQNLVKPFIEKHTDADISIVLGTAGAGRKDDAEKFQEYLKEQLTLVKNIKVVSDVEITMRGAFEKENGAILIAGTGSILYYKFDDNVNRVGGFGRLIGDEGSGYTIGRRGLNILSKMLDGRLQQTSLIKLAKEKFGIETAQQLITKVYNEDFDIAGFAETVIKAAENNDELAIKVVDEETDELFNHFNVLNKNDSPNNINLVLSGGLLENDNYFRNTLIHKIESRLPQIKIVEPKHRPEYGAVLIAKELF